MATTIYFSSQENNIRPLRVMLCSIASCLPFRSTGAVLTDADVINDTLPLYSLVALPSLGRSCVAPFPCNKIRLLTRRVMARSCSVRSGTKLLS